MLRIAEYNTKTGEKIDLKEMAKRFGLYLRYSEYNGDVSALVQIDGYPFFDIGERPFIKFVKRKLTKNKRKNIIRIINREFYYYNGEFKIPKNPKNMEMFFDTLYEMIKQGYIERVKD